MKYTTLGKSDLKVSRIGLGCMGFGDRTNGMHTWTLDEKDSRDIIKYALDRGINFFDTAMAYQNGTGEAFLGRALKDFAKREDIVLATKFTPRTPEDIANKIGGRTYVNQMLDKSLQRLGMDYVDLYIYHMWDFNTPLEDIMAGLNDVVKAGKARYIGISNCFAWQLAKANALAEKNHWPQFVSVQNHYNMIFREEEREMAPFCYEENIAMTPYSPLAGGRLSKITGQTSERLIKDDYARYKYDASHDQDLATLKVLEELSKSKNLPMTEIAIAWLLQKVTAPIAGATKKSHIDGLVNAVNIELSQAEMALLEKDYRPHVLSGVMASYYK